MNQIQTVSTDADRRQAQPSTVANVAGANSMFYGDKLLTTSSPQAEKDRALLERPGMRCATEAALTPSDAAAKIEVCQMR